jgi:hypothetical protein
MCKVNLWSEEIPTIFLLVFYTKLYVFSTSLPVLLQQYEYKFMI